MQQITTERLILRQFRENDYDDLYEFLSQLADDEFEGYPGITYENGREHLAYRVGSEDFYAVELRESEKVIGNIYFGHREFDAREVGYIINKDYQRKGYALEALTAVINDAFRNGTHRVYAECDPRNERSWRLLEKAGLRREAHFVQNIFFHRNAAGEPIWKDTYVYAKLREENEPSDNADTEQRIVRELLNKDEKAAFAFAQKIGTESAASDRYLKLIPVFSSMLEARNAFQRTRAFMLICNQARWDDAGTIDQVFDRMTPLLNDVKPTVVRQCLGALQELVLFRPEMHPRIEEAVRKIDISRYKDSMAPLIRKDMDALLRMLE